MLEGGEVEWHSFLGEDKGRIGIHQHLSGIQWSTSTDTRLWRKQLRFTRNNNLEFEDSNKPLYLYCGGGEARHCSSVSTFDGHFTTT